MESRRQVSILRCRAGHTRNLPDLPPRPRNRDSQEDHQQRHRRLRSPRAQPRREKTRLLSDKKLPVHWCQRSRYGDGERDSPRPNRRSLHQHRRRLDTRQQTSLCHQQRERRGNRSSRLTRSQRKQRIPVAHSDDAAPAASQRRTKFRTKARSPQSPRSPVRNSDQ